jgi:hypothetical protein
MEYFPLTHRNSTRLRSAKKSPWRDDVGALAGQSFDFHGWAIRFESLRCIDSRQHEVLFLVEVDVGQMGVRIGLSCKFSNPPTFHSS